MNSHKIDVFSLLFKDSCFISVLLNFMPHLKQIIIYNKYVIFL